MNWVPPAPIEKQNRLGLVSTRTAPSKIRWENQKEYITLYFNGDRRLRSDVTKA